MLPLEITANTKPKIRKAFAAQVQAAMLQAHQRHAQTDMASGKQVSFGLVRMANIGPLQDVACELFRLGAPADTHIHLCVYHSRFPLLLRSEIERQLDTVLDRRGEADPVLSRPEVRTLLARHPASNHLFVVLASPLAEVGRDHDYDWAVVEPSSMRSLIQLAGRVRRHRGESPDSPNVLIFERNLRSFEQPGKAAFIRPGFEEDSASGNRKDALRMSSNNLQILLPDEHYQTLDARPRIQRPEDIRTLRKSRLVDLEHFRMYLLLRDDKPAEENASTFWTSPLAHLTWAMPQQQPFRDSSYREQTFVFLPDEEAAKLIPHRLQTQGRIASHIPALESVKSVALAQEMGSGITPWMQLDLLALLGPLAEAQGLELTEAAKRYTEVKAPKDSRDGSATQWCWHPVLGLAVLQPDRGHRIV